MLAGFGSSAPGCPFFFGAAIAWRCGPVAFIQRSGPPPCTGSGGVGHLGRLGRRPASSVAHWGRENQIPPAEEGDQQAALESSVCGGFLSSSVSHSQVGGIWFDKSAGQEIGCKSHGLVFILTTIMGLKRMHGPHPTLYGMDIGFMPVLSSGRQGCGMT